MDDLGQRSGNFMIFMHTLRTDFGFFFRSILDSKYVPALICGFHMPKSIDLLYQQMNECIRQTYYAIQCIAKHNI